MTRDRVSKRGLRASTPAMTRGGGSRTTSPVRCPSRRESAAVATAAIVRYPPRRESAALAAAAVVFAAGCSGASGSSDAGVVRDSAGIAVVESATAAWSAGGSWEIAPTARLTTALPESGSVPSSGRIWGAVFLGGGRIALADALERRVHVLDARGRPIASMGGAGDGDGRLASLVRLFAYRGDSLAVYDLTRDAIEVFSSAGEHGRTIELDTGPGRRTPFATLADGRFALWNGAGDSGRRSERVGDDAPVSIASSDGSRLEPIAIVPNRGATEMFVAAGADEIAWSKSDRTEIFRVDARSGAVRTLLRWGSAGDSTRPPSALRWASGGQLWARRPTLSTAASVGPGAAETWDVFDADARWLGPLRLPPGTTLLDIGPDGVLVRVPGEGADRIAHHEIRPAAGR